MGEIFGGAKTVVVWLGRKSIPTALALLKVRWLLDNGSGFQEKAQALKTEAAQPSLSSAISAALDWPALRWVLGRGFFERVWTLQEVVLAKDIVFYIGNERLFLDHIVNNFPYMDSENIHDLEMSGEKMNASSVAMLRGLIFMHKMRMQRINSGTLCTLEVSLAEARRRRTTQTVDKVFSILSISAPILGARELRANYRHDVIKVYSECAKALLASATGLRLLSLVGQLRHGAVNHISFPSISTKHLLENTEFVQGLPSWVPDLSTPVRPCFQDILNILTYSHMHRRRDQSRCTA